jgi:hypothetical protein
MDVDQNSTHTYGKATFDREYPTSFCTGKTSRANEAVRNVSALAPQFVPVSFWTKYTRAPTFFVVFEK